jgi:hypothetical protein
MHNWSQCDRQWLTIGGCGVQRLLFYPLITLITRIFFSGFLAPLRLGVKYFSR